MIAIEREGITPRGTYHNMLGQDYSEGRARIDYLVEEAGKRHIPTIGVGDGGNEIEEWVRLPMQCTNMSRGR